MNISLPLLPLGWPFPGGAQVPHITWEASRSHAQRRGCQVSTHRLPTGPRREQPAEAECVSDPRLVASGASALALPLLHEVPAPSPPQPTAGEQWGWADGASRTSGWSHVQRLWLSFWAHCSLPEPRESGCVPTFFPPVIILPPYSLLLCSSSLDSFLTFLFFLFLSLLDTTLHPPWPSPFLLCLLISFLSLPSSLQPPSYQ